jgi:hypothetical protein
MSDYRFSRRSLLASVGAGAALLPLLSATKGFSQVPAAPKRLVILQTTNGVIKNAFWPQTPGPLQGQTLPEILSPLEPHKEDIIVFGGIDLKTWLNLGEPFNGSTNSHDDLGVMLTGAPPAVAKKPGYDGPYPLANGPSIDYVVGEHLAKSASIPFPSLQLGVNIGWGLDGVHLARYVSYRGPAIGSAPAQQPDGITPELNPYTVFDKLFSNNMVDMDAQNAIRARRKSVLDFVGRDLERLAARLGTDDKAKIQAHLQSIRELERTGAGLGECGPPDIPQGLNVNGGFKAGVSDLIYPTQTKMMLDMIVSALKCDATRAVTLMMSGSHNGGLIFSWLGDEFSGPGDEYEYRDHHDLTHRQGQSPDHTRRKILAEQWFMKQFAYLLEEMKKVPEARADGSPGTMLDNSVVAILNSGSDGAGHTVTNLPWVIAGSCGGYFKTGQYLKYDGAAHNGLLCAFGNAMDVPMDYFGDPAYPGELAGLRG